MAGLPGVKVGPLDPDATSEFGQVGRNNSARQLIRLHHQAHPPVLVQALAKKLDPERTKGLELDEVRKYLGKLKLDNGDPLVPEGARVVGASVRGERDRPQVLTFTYETAESKRTGKWFAEYNADVLPDSYDAGSELAKVQEMKDRGVVAFDSEGTATEQLRRELAEVRRQNRSLRELAEGRAGKDADVPAEVDESDAALADARSGDQIVEDNERLGRENVELKARLEQLESALGTATQPGPLAGTNATEEPPLADYDDLNATDLVKVIKDEDTSEETRQAILAYELKNRNRSTVVTAAEERISAAS